MQDASRLGDAAQAARKAPAACPEFPGLPLPGPPAVRPGIRQLEPCPHRTIYDAKSTEKLPGSVVRKEGEPPTGDPAADEAYDGLGHTHRLYAEAFGRNSIDGKGLHLDATVHYGRPYDNAFWDGQQMVFGDGDGQVFERFTKSLSVIGHELTHGVTQYSAGLVYRNQAGALNESMSDVFGALVEQYVRKQSTAEAELADRRRPLHGPGQGAALRSMKAPGTAYDDDVLGKDPQPDSMDGYVRTSADNGGVHINSGIPNRAFCLVAPALGGNAWDAPAQIRYETLTGGKLSPPPRSVPSPRQQPPLPRSFSARIPRNMTPCAPRGKL